LPLLLSLSLGAMFPVSLTGCGLSATWLGITKSDPTPSSGATASAPKATLAASDQYLCLAVAAEDSLSLA
jgi:hypothetical protein